MFLNRCGQGHADLFREIVRSKDQRYVGSVGTSAFSRHCLQFARYLSGLSSTILQYFEKYELAWKCTVDHVDVYTGNVYIFCWIPRFVFYWSHGRESESKCGACGFRVVEPCRISDGLQKKTMRFGKNFDGELGFATRRCQGGPFFAENQDRMTRVCPRYPNMSGGCYVSRVKLRPSEFLLPFNQP